MLVLFNIQYVFITQLDKLDKIYFKKGSQKLLKFILSWCTVFNIHVVLRFRLGYMV